MDKLVSAGLINSPNGTAQIDMSKLGKAMTKEIRPQRVTCQKDEHGDGNKLTLEFSEEDKEKMRKINNVLSDFEKGNLDLNEYIKSMEERQKLQDKYSSMSTTQLPPHEEENKYAGMAGMRIMGNSAFNGHMQNTWSQRHDEEYACMRYTKEERESGMVPIAKACFPGDEDFGKDSSVTNECRTKEEFHVCVVKKVLNDKGEYETKYYGDDIAVKYAKTEAAADDFKAAAVEKWRKESLLDIYNLASELRRYNSDLADELLWFKHESDAGEYNNFKLECMRKLNEYRSKDPLCNVKSTPLYSDGNTHLLPPVPATDEDLEEYMDELERRCESNRERTTQEQEEDIIKQYEKSFDKRIGGIKQEIDAIKHGKDCSSIIKRLQLMENICVCSSQEEYDNEMRWRAEMNRRLNPVQQSSKNMYGMYKMMLAYKKHDLPDGLTYDQWFDKWWSAPVEYEKKYHLQHLRREASQRMVMRFKYIEDSQLTPDERQRNYENAILQGYRDFDHGKVNMNADMNEFFNGEYGFGYLVYCCREQKLKEQKNSLKRLYDPEQLHDIFRQKDPNRSPLLNPKPDYDALVSSKEFQERRRLFKEAIYKKNILGALH